MEEVSANVYALHAMNFTSDRVVAGSMLALHKGNQDDHFCTLRYDKLLENDGSAKLKDLQISSVRRRRKRDIRRLILNPVNMDMVPEAGNSSLSLLQNLPVSSLEDLLPLKTETNSVASQRTLNNPQESETKTNTVALGPATHNNPMPPQEQMLDTLAREDLLQQFETAERPYVLIPVPPSSIAKHFFSTDYWESPVTYTVIREFISNLQSLKIFQYDPKGGIEREVDLSQFHTFRNDNIDPTTALSDMKFIAYSPNNLCRRSALVSMKGERESEHVVPRQFPIVAVDSPLPTHPKFAPEMALGGFSNGRRSSKDEKGRFCSNDRELLPASGTGSRNTGLNVNLLTSSDVACTSRSVFQEESATSLAKLKFNHSRRGCIQEHRSQRRVPSSSEAKPGEKSKKEAIRKASRVSDVLVDAVNGGVQECFIIEKRIELEIQVLAASIARFMKQIDQWLTATHAINTAVKEIGDFENWMKTMEFDCKSINAAIHSIHQD
ncbi:hypothetical protein FEM48_Zijuj02G0113500 [Ziziphus jujuba var. spinosa]|uniref:Biogenesis of lysosome-related organelles complex 1 subunit 1 n=1 Tax=Ziziphus jujuba var. spinosa TaxID=714518 RepID=A0A978VVF7_ZIZJJ|nr:hypothetical protein FEM48_Zijuj02G0113500 [Ziziphus jujuba var. spinosa]